MADNGNVGPHICMGPAISQQEKQVHKIAHLCWRCPNRSRNGSLSICRLTRLMDCRWSKSINLILTSWCTACPCGPTLSLSSCSVRCSKAAQCRRMCMSAHSNLTFPRHTIVLRSNADGSCVPRWGAHHSGASRISGVRPVRRSISGHAACYT